MQKHTLRRLPLLIAAAFASEWIYAADAVQDVEQVQLEEVVVTGERTNRSGFETATSNRVFTAPNIDRSGHNLSATDLLKQTVNTVDLGSGNDLPTVRGVDGSGPAVGAVAFFAGTRPRLNLSIDGRSATYNEYAFGTQSLWDMQQVEVLRGPQSHVRGQNAVAGAVVMRSKDPTDEWEGALRLGLGNQKTRNIAGVVSGPIVKNNLAFRLSAERQQRESYEPFVSYEPTGNPRRVENTNVRFKLLLTPENHPDFYSHLTLNHIRSRAPQNEIMGNTASRRFLKEKPVFVTGSTSGIWDVSWQLNDYLKLENKLVYGRYHNERLHLPMTVSPQGVPAELKGRELQSVRALFAETTYSPSEKWDITAAARIEKETHKRSGGSGALHLDLDKGQTVFLPKIDIAFKPTDQWVSGIKAARGYNPGGAGITFGRPVVTYTYEPEYVNNYEWYTRWRSADRRLQLSGNLFLNHYRDMQLPFYLGTNSVVIRNAKKVHTYGAELAADWQATDSLKLTTGLGLLNTKIKSYPDSGIEGNKLGRAPKYTANIGVKYLNDKGWEAGGDVRFYGGYYSAADNAESGKIGAYNQVNLYTAYNFKQGRVSLYADNVFNRRRPIFISSADRQDALYQRPRSVGVSAEWNF